MLRKTTAFLLTLILLFTAAGACADTVTALAMEPYLESNTGYACRARLHDYDPETNMLEIELVVPEVFAKEDIEGLWEGDSIWAEGREVAIQTISRAEGEVLLNENTEDEVFLTEDLQGYYRTTDPVSADYYCLELARIELPVPEHLVLLDANDPEAGDLPKVYGAQEFIAQKTQDPEFCRDDVYVVLDGNGELAVIYRYYTPWG